MAGNLVTNKIQLGDSATASQNFSFKTNADGTAKLARGADGTLGDILTVGVDGDVKLKKTNATSMVRLNTANGYGSTNNRISRFTTIVTNQGSDITYVDSVTLGASFTINTDGVYSITYCGSWSTTEYAGLSINTTQPTVGIYSVTPVNVLAIQFLGTNTATVTVSWCGYLVAGDIIRPHINNGATATNPTQFTITRVT